MTCFASQVLAEDLEPTTAPPNGCSPSPGLSEAARAEVAHLFRTCERRLLAQARHLTRNAEDAHDLVQDTFERAMNAYAEGVPKKLAWLSVILRNLWRDSVRRRNRQPQTVPLAAAECSAVTSPTDSTREELLAAFSHAAALLDGLSREVVRLRFVENKSYRDIAELLAVKIGTVSVRIHRARAVLVAAVQARRTRATATIAMQALSLFVNRSNAARARAVCSIAMSEVRASQKNSSAAQFGSPLAVRK